MTIKKGYDLLQGFFDGLSGKKAEAIPINPVPISRNIPISIEVDSTDLTNQLILNLSNVSIEIATETQNIQEEFNNNDHLLNADYLKQKIAQYQNNIKLLLFNVETEFTANPGHAEDIITTYVEGIKNESLKGLELSELLLTQLNEPKNKLILERVFKDVKNIKIIVDILKYWNIIDDNGLFIGNNKRTLGVLSAIITHTDKKGFYKTEYHKHHAQLLSAYNIYLGTSFKSTRKRSDSYKNTLLHIKELI